LIAMWASPCGVESTTYAVRLRPEFGHVNGDFVINSINRTSKKVS
jgi:hypothetical protein